MKHISPFTPKQSESPYEFENIHIATTCAGIKNNTKNDLVLFKFRDPVNFSGVYTLSDFPAAPVIRCQTIQKKHKKIHKKIHGLLINSGNANACTSWQGLQDIEDILYPLAQHYQLNTDDFLMCSTGVIGERLPTETIIKSYPNLWTTTFKNIPNTSQNTFIDAAKAIMTTDTYPKYISKTLTINQHTFHITAIAKGAGMIAPNMATMLSFIFTDFPLPTDLHYPVLKKSVDNSFNLITVDGDTSTNDTVLLFSPADQKHTRYTTQQIETFSCALNEVNRSLAEMIIKDAEGIRKLIRIHIKNAHTHEQAKKVALSIANSPLCKTAIAGEDANWGRIFMAIGKAQAKINPNTVSLKIGDILVAKDGHIAPDYNEKDIEPHMKSNEIKLSIDLKIGNQDIEILTSDLNENYISINADYRS